VNPVHLPAPPHARSTAATSVSHDEPRQHSTGSATGSAPLPPSAPVYELGGVEEGVEEARRLAQLYPTPPRYKMRHPLLPGPTTASLPSPLALDRASSGGPTGPLCLADIGLPTLPPSNQDHVRCPLPHPSTNQPVER
jgi:hypothetical protein